MAHANRTIEEPRRVGNSPRREAAPRGPETEQPHPALGRVGRSRTRLVFAVCAAGVIAVPVLLLSIKGAGSADNFAGLTTFTVRRDSLTITVTESGNTESLESTDVMCEVEGRTTILSIAPEGTVITPQDVEQGKILCELDSSVLQQSCTQQRITFLTARAAYTEAQEAYEIQEKQNESDIEAARLAVEFGLMDLQKHLGDVLAQKLLADVNEGPNENVDFASLLQDPNLGGSALEKLNQLQDTIALAKSNYERANDKLAWTSKLHEKQYVSDTELRADQLEVQSLDIRKKQADMALDLYRRYDFAKETKQFLSVYREARRELERTLARCRSQLAQAQAKLESTEASYNLQKERLEKLEKQLTACIIRVPTTGILVYGTSADYWRKRTDPIEVGDQLHQQQKIFTIPHSNRMGVVLGVHETSVDKVRPRQRAKIIVEPFPDRTFQGEVLEVAPLPDPHEGGLRPDVKVYTTRVTIEGLHDFLKPGMSAKVEIFVDQLDDVMIVPIASVARRDGRKICYVLTPTGPEPREVQTGAFNDTFVQIVSGLEIGEQVLTVPPRSA